MSDVAIDQKKRSFLSEATALEHTVEHVIDKAKEEVHDVTSPHVEHLSVGDSYEISGAATLSAGGVDSDEAGSLSVTHTDAGTYVIEATGNYSMKGAGFASGGGGAGIKLAAASKEDAERLFAILEHAGLAASAPLGTGAFFFHTTADDAAFVHEHVSAVSISGEAAAKLKGTLGRPGAGAQLSASAQIGGTFTERVTVEMEHGALKGVVLEASCQAKAHARAGWGAAGATSASGARAQGARDLGLYLEGAETTTISCKTHLELPQTLTPDQRKMDPGTLLTSLQGQMLRTGREDIIAVYEGNIGGNRSWKTAGVVGKATITLEGVKSDDMTALVGSLAQQDLERALQHVSTQRATVAIEAFRDGGDTYGGTVGSEKSAEVSVELHTRERHRTFAPAPTSGTPRQVLRTLLHELHGGYDSSRKKDYGVLC